MLSNRNLRLLVVGQFLSAVGDQFYLIAMPWLALEISGRALVAGAVLAVAGIPRAAFMLLGGAVTDRYSPKWLLIGSNGLQALLMGLLGLVIMIPFAQLWFLFAVAFATGLIDAFGLPAFNTMLPRIAADHELEGGNIYVQGANLASAVVGPALAGLLISAAAAGTVGGPPLRGLGLAFLVDAATFLVGISFFWAIRPSEALGVDDGTDEPLIRAVGRVFEYIGTDAQLKYLFGLMSVLGLVLTGTIRVGFPLLAEAAGGVRDFGNMTSAFGAGMVLGMVGVKVFPRPPKAISGLVMLGWFSAVPAGLIVLSFTPAIATILGVILLMGIGFGYVFIYMLSWLQRRTPKRMHGRIMAVVFFTTIGLSPISQIVMGYLLDLSLQGTLLGVGSFVLGLILLAGARRGMWRLREQPRTEITEPVRRERV